MLERAGADADGGDGLDGWAVAWYFYVSAGLFIFFIFVFVFAFAFASCYTVGIIVICKHRHGMG